MKTSRKTKEATAGTAATPGTSGTAATKSTSGASEPLNISTMVIRAFRQNKSKMTTLTEVDLIAILDRALATADLPMPDIEFDPAELEYDPDIDVYPVPSKPSKPSKPSEAPSVLKPSKVSSSGSVSITIRVPVPVVNAFKAMALKKCVGYQTLINRQLRSVLTGS